MVFSGVTSLCEWEAVHVVRDSISPRSGPALAQKWSQSKK
jgi:hypothetical protein